MKRKSTRFVKKKNKIKKDMSDSRFSRIYYDPSNVGAFGGIQRLQGQLKNKREKEQVTKWLPTQLAYSLHKPMKKKFPTRTYTTSGLNDLWQMDLMEMIPYAKINKGYKYILTCIDVFSRFVRAVAVKSKSASDVADAIENMLTTPSSIPRHIQTDMGKEFYNQRVQALFKKHNINHYSVTSQFKAAVVERFNRTLRQKLARYFTAKGNKEWINVLPSIIDTYNKSHHRGIFNMRPIDITLENQMELWEKQNQQQQQQPQSKKKKNTKQVIPLLNYVRISKSTNSPFIKNFDQNWSDEVFRVVGIDKKENQPTMYTIEDLSGEVIHDKFYNEKLQDIGAKPPSIYRIEKIVSTRGKGVYKQHLVKWHGYDSSHNSWIDANQLIQHKEK